MASHQQPGSSGPEPGWLTASIDAPEATLSASGAFWSAVTGWRRGGFDGAHGEFCALIPDDAEPCLRLQRLGSDIARIHLDVHVAEPDAAVARALLLGAELLRADPGHPVLSSPGGLTFCLAEPVGGPPPGPVRWPGGASLVNQVCLDIPAPRFDAELAFWSELTGGRARGVDGGIGDFTALDAPAPGPLRLLLQRLHHDAGPVTAHLDLAAEDRAAEVARHLALGARLLAVRQEWTVLLDPSRHPYCVTDRPPQGRA